MNVHIANREQTAEKWKLYLGSLSLQVSHHPLSLKHNRTKLC